jgi:glyoxylase-like metal-dependent hydrolase (beta-lactamase superfamily II)
VTLPQKPFSPDHKTLLIEGDKDLFGDGNLVILSTPGHTPGHQSLLVHLVKTGYVVLSGDAVNWDNRRVPSFNYDTALWHRWRKSRASSTKSTRNSGSTTTNHRATLAVMRRNPTSNGAC